jgi:hypothetical protein
VVYLNVGLAVVVWRHIVDFDCDRGNLYFLCSYRVDSGKRMSSVEVDFGD